MNQAGMGERDDRMTEWIRLMIQEIEQKEAEAAEAREEQRRRESAPDRRRHNGKAAKQD